MKNYIKYYYGLDVCELFLVNDKYLFNVDNTSYMLKVCNNLEICSYYLKLENELNKYGFFFKIVPNREKSLITYIDNEAYVLLKNNYNFFYEKISVFDMKNNLFISSMNSELLELKRFPWVNFWENKIDYLENWILDKKSKYKNINYILNYFLGVSENALLYLKETIVNETATYTDNFSIQHDRVGVGNYLYDYYDPTLVVIDHPSRDISEYIKSMMLTGKFDIGLFEKYLEKNNFSKYGAMVMYSRILFPSYFYDYFEDFVKKNSSISLLKLEEKINDFQIFLSQISRFFYYKYKIEIPSWIMRIN